MNENIFSIQCDLHAIPNIVNSYNMPLEKMTYQFSTKMLTIEQLDYSNLGILQQCQALSREGDWHQQFLYWEVRHFSGVTKEHIRDKAKQELAILLETDFLDYDDLVCESKVLAAAEALQDMGLNRAFAKRYAILQELTQQEDGLYLFSSDNLLNRYLQNRGIMADATIIAFLRFRYIMKCCHECLHKNDVGQAALSENQNKIISKLCALVDRGEWKLPATAENIKCMILTALGATDKKPGKEEKMSKAFWKLLEEGKGDRVRIVFSNLIGYFRRNGLLEGKSPALCKMFFNEQEGYSNIDKGFRESDMSTGFREIQHLLDSYLQKIVISPISAA